jgi:hypothetical protein
MSFDLVYKKSTGQIVRFGYDLTTLKGEAILSFAEWTPFSDFAVDVKKKVLIPATDETRYSYEPGIEQLWTDVREKRAMLISGSDFMMMPDYPISDAFRAKLAAYRQALRDVTKQTDPANIIWPDVPSE